MYSVVAKTLPTRILSGVDARNEELISLSSSTWLALELLWFFNSELQEKQQITLSQSFSKVTCSNGIDVSSKLLMATAPILPKGTHNGRLLISREYPGEEWLRCYSSPHMSGWTVGWCYFVRTVQIGSNRLYCSGCVTLWRWWLHFRKVFISLSRVAVVSVSCY